MAFYQLKFEQEVKASLSDVWDFISTPQNLKKITPSYMGFDIIGDIPKKMYEGLIIHYNVRPVLGIKTEWVTEITHVKENEYFVDEQRVGPYSMWHHQHFIKESKTGVIMEDILSYQPPFGLLGAVANQLIIKNKVQSIFAYRKNAVDEFFSKNKRTS
jgi:ligand-binding SRPBCC domain-containing protein